MSQTTLDIKEPGLNVLPPGVERYIVNAGGITGIQIFPDDEIQIINKEGNQICEINLKDLEWDLQTWINVAIKKRMVQLVSCGDY